MRTTSAPSRPLRSPGKLLRRSDLAPLPLHEGIGWGLLLLGLGLAGCLLSQEPTPSPVLSSYPAAPAPRNLFGPPGAWLAGQLFAAWGSTVYLLLIIWFVLVLLFLVRRQRGRWLGRLVGWLLLWPWSAVLASHLTDYSRSRSLTGGQVGLWLTQQLAAHCSPAAQLLLLLGVGGLGLVLAGDFILWRAWRGAAWLLGRCWRREGSGRPTSANAVATSPGKTALRHRREPLPEDTTAAAPAAPSPAAPAADQLAQVPIIRPAPVVGEEAFHDYQLPPLSLLDDPEPFPYEEHDKELRAQAALLEKTFRDFDVHVRVVGINTGPVVTQYEVALETGLRVHKVTSLADDLALNLKVPSVRIVAPIPGKNAVGIEVPNAHRAIVRLKEVILTAGKPAARLKLPLFLGKDTEGKPLVYDLAEMPHLLIAGRTGTGKSVCLNTIILSILMTRRPDEVKMIMIDPKMNELTEYGRIPHLMHPVVKDVRKAEAILSWAVDKMEERYDLLSRARVRNLAAYNELGFAEICRRLQPDEEERARLPERMPYIVIFVDEMGDLMMQMKREVEGHIIRLAQKSRAAGIHLVVATQKPTVDVITGLIKSNLPARICFQVSSRSDSRVVLDEIGADKLLGKGDMLFLQPGTSTLIRAQGAYASDEEIRRVVEHLECDPKYSEELLQLRTTTPVSGNGNFLDSLRARDELYPQAIEVVVREGRGSVSLLQRALGIGYGRAARLIDFMAEDGIVGPYKGSSAREVLYTPEEWEQAKAAGRFLPRRN
jgi:S-DNA-T family DNA segregation ATPase FtsK/SpoIIIE